MIVLVHCPLEASSAPPCLEMEIEPTGSVGSLKALVTTQIGVLISERVLVHHGIVLDEGTSLSSIVDPECASERIAAVVQMLHQPKKKARMETQLADDCTCGHSKFMLTPTLPPLEQLVDGPQGQGAMDVIRSILCNQFIVRQMMNYFLCPVCSDDDLSQGSFSNPFDGDVMLTVQNAAASAELERLGICDSVTEGRESIGDLSDSDVDDGGTTVTLTGSVQGKRTDESSGQVSVLVAWDPVGVCEDEWLPEGEYPYTRIVSKPWGHSMAPARASSPSSTGLSGLLYNASVSRRKCRRKVSGPY